MTQFETYSLILGVVQAVAIVISLVALWWQLRQFNENMKCDAYARHVEDYSRVSELLIEHPELARIYHQGQGEVDDLNDEDKKFYNFVALVIGYYERLFNLHRRGWIDDKTWASWEVWLVEQWFPMEMFHRYWRNEGQWFHSDFDHFISRKYDEYCLAKRTGQKPQATRKANSGPSAVAAASEVVGRPA